MRLLVFSDVHGNLPALEAAWTYFQKFSPDRVLFLGDAVGYFPGEIEVLDRLVSSGAQCLSGNHEAYLLGRKAVSPAKEFVYRLEPARDRLGETRLQTLASWPTEARWVEGNDSVWAIHGSPEDPTFGYVYPDTDWSSYPKLETEKYLFCANTHRPFVKQRGREVWINVGSVGLPRDRGDFGAFALWDVGQLPKIYRFKIPVESTLDLYGDRIHESVVSCLARRPQSFFGEVLP